jgi:Glycosyl transferase family 2
LDPPKTLSVIVPIFNEVATVQVALDAILAKQIQGLEIEVILVESNSTDGTRDIVLSYQGKSRVNIILEDRPRGKGHAVRAGLASASRQSATAKPSSPLAHVTATPAGSCVSTMINPCSRSCSTRLTGGSRL